jgi:hypothetical protein
MLKTISPFFIPMSVALTGVAGEAVLANTNNVGAGADVELSGGVTDLATSQIALSIGRTPVFSSSGVPVLSLFGKLGSAHPRERWKPALAISQKSIINATVDNPSGEAAGTIVFIGQQPKYRGLDIDESRLGLRVVVPIDPKFTGVASELTSNNLQPFNSDFLLQGFLRDDELAAATIRILGAYSEFWMRDFVPAWSLAGNSAAQIPVQKLDEYYLIPKGGTITVEFQNDATTPDASGKLWAVGRALN